MTQGRPSTDDIVIRPAGPPVSQGGDNADGRETDGRETDGRETDDAPDQPRSEDSRTDAPYGEELSDGAGEGGRADPAVDVRSEDVRIDPVPADAPPRDDGAPDDRAGPRTPEGAPTPGVQSQENVPLLDGGVAEEFLRRWSDVQARFVDDPRRAVLDGDSLVAELVQALAQRFSQHKSGLEEQWSRGEEPSTEELRLALQQYRSFFQRLLAT